MERSYNLDIFLVILFTFSATLSLFIYPLNSYPLRIIPCILMLFFLPGYALVMALYPVKADMSMIKRFISGIILSAVLTLLLTSINLFKIVTIPQNFIFYLLAIFTIIVCYIAFKRRKTITWRIRCKRCNGYYNLEEGETLDDFYKCNCGGELEYAADMKKKRSLPQFKSPDVLIVILLIFITVTVLELPQLCNSGLRSVLVPVLLFFLSGYALTAAIYPYNNSISILKRLLLSVGFSIIILVLSVFLMIYSFKTAPSKLFIFSLSIFTVALILIAALRRFKTPKTPEKTKESKIKKVIEEKKKSEVKTSKVKEFISANKEEYKKGSKSTYIDLILIFLLTILSIIFVISPVLDSSFIRTILGILFILFLPGYSLIAALFPKIGDLDNIERLALSFGLSIVISPLIGLALNYTPFKIELTPILVSLSIFTILMLIITFFRRNRVPEAERFSVDFSGFFKNVKSNFNHENRTDKILSIILIASIVLAISTTAYVIASPKQGEKFTEFYILGPNGKASDYPVNLTAGQTGSVIIGIVNHEYSTTNYKMVLKLNNQTINQQNVTLANNDKYENTFNFTAGAGAKQKLEFLLYKLPDDTSIYRSLHLWINVS